MNEFTAYSAEITTHSAVEKWYAGKDQSPVEHNEAFIGIDLDKRPIAVAIAKHGRQRAECVKIIANQPKSVEKWFIH